MAADETPDKGKYTAPYLRKGKWVGAITVRGRKHWVGSFATKGAWKDAAATLRTRLNEHAHAGAPSTLTFRRFVVERGWPHNYPRNRRKPITFDTHTENIKPFLDEFGDRTLVPGLSRTEARSWALENPHYCHTVARAMINDIMDDELMPSNPFARLGIPAGRGREDIDVISEQDFEDLKRLARTTRGDEYGVVLETLLHFLGEEGCRPGEAFALRWRNIDFDKNTIKIEHTADHKGRVTPPKNGKTRTIVLFPDTKRRLLAMPRLSEEFVFPSVRGRMLVASRFYYFWNPVRVAWESTRPEGHWLHARLKADPTDHFDPYELRHRAATWMCTPRPHGLGLAPVDVALQMGHTDGGALVMRLYAHPREESARDRILKAANGWTPPADGNDTADADGSNSTSGEEATDDDR